VIVLTCACAHAHITYTYGFMWVLAPRPHVQRGRNGRDLRQLCFVGGDETALAPQPLT